MLADFDVRRHDNRVFRACKRMEAAWAAGSRCWCLRWQAALEAELARRPAWLVARISGEL